MKYSYTECEDNISQYSGYDLKNQNFVNALYVPARMKEDVGNPYIEALPYPRDDKAVTRDYTHHLLSYNYDKVSEMSKLDKMLQVGMLKTLRFPLPFHRDLEFYMYNSLITSYRARRQIHSNNNGINIVAKNQECKANSILTGDDSSSTNGGFSLIGYSGCGKSSAINTLVSRYPQVIIHEDEDGYFTQIPYLVVNCVSNSNFAALYQGIGNAIDKALGNVEPVYSKDIERTNGLGKKAEKIKQYIEMFAIGIIIFDEIQLIDFEHTKENTFDSLLTLANRTKVAIAVVGTEDARDKMFHELRTVRRIGTMINGNTYCENKEFFEYLAKHLFSYQWFDEPVELTKELTDVLYDVTKGIVDQLISIYSCMNYEYLAKKDKKPVINEEYIRKVAKKYYPGMQVVLGNIEQKESERKMEKIMRGADIRINKLLDQTRQQEQMENMINSKEEENQSLNMLKNIVISIQGIYDFTDSQIEDAYNTVMSKKSSAGKGEKEITRLVIDMLQNAPKRKIKKDKIKTPNVEQMRSFLNIEE